MNTKPTVEREERQNAPVEQSGNVVRFRRSSWTDTEIVKGLREGQASAADALVDKYTDLIEGRIWRLLGPDSEHADVVQNSFVSIIKSIPKLKDPKALPAWVNKIVINQVRTELNRRMRRRKLSREVSASVNDTRTVNNPEQEYVLYRNKIFEIIRNMKPEEQIIFHMKFIVGAELQQIADATGRSVATVKRRVIRVRDIFAKKALEDQTLASLVSDIQGGDPL